MSEIKFMEEVPAELDEKMKQDSIAYEHSHGVDYNYKKFSLVYIDDNNEAIGVLEAFTVFSEIYVEHISVLKEHRGKGFGKKLLAALENRFKGKGFNNINLITNQFQAPEFYKKCGFTVEFVRENKKNPKLTKTFFIKYFDDETQNQGILNSSEKYTCYK